jgi:metal-responsive CopG/Arc/MetJ family transcriptional regulator
MEIVSVKFQEDILKKMDDVIAKHNFNSRTEFLREAVRDKLSEIERDELIRKFMSFSGKASKKTTDEQNKKIREELGKEYLATLEKRFR